MVQVQGLIIV